MRPARAVLAAEKSVNLRGISKHHGLVNRFGALIAKYKTETGDDTGGREGRDNEGDGEGAE